MRRELATTDGLVACRDDAYAQLRKSTRRVQTRPLGKDKMAGTPHNSSAREGAPSASVGDGTTTGDLLGRAQTGDHEAEWRLFSDQLDRLRVRVRRHPRFRLLRGRATEDDIVADVFVRALSTGLLDRFDDRGKGSLERLLGAVLDKVTLDALRRAGASKRSASRPVLSVSLAGEWQSASTPICDRPSPTSMARTEELIDRARALLDDRGWQVWSAVEIGGLQPLEVARRLGITASAARGLLRRARAKLLEALDRSDRPGAS